MDKRVILKYRQLPKGEQVREPKTTEAQKS